MPQLLPAVARRDHVMITEDDRGPAINIASWLGVTLTILFVFVRIGSKYSVLRKLTIDDAVIFCTMIFAIGYTVALSWAVANGLGKSPFLLVAPKFNSFEGCVYASQLLYIPTICLAKLSTLAYLRGLSPETPFAVVNLILEMFVIIWGFTTELAIAFQCRLPRPWDFGWPGCIDTQPFWNAEAAFDLFTDLAIILLPIFLVWGIRMPTRKKTLVIVIFGTRVLILPASILRLYFLNAYSPYYPNFLTYQTSLLTTVHLHLATIITCLPFLKPFMENLSTGGFSTTVDPMDSSYSRKRKRTRLGIGAGIGAGVGKMKLSLNTLVSSKSRGSRQDDVENETANANPHIPTHPRELEEVPLPRIRSPSLQPAPAPGTAPTKPLPTLQIPRSISWTTLPRIRPSTAPGPSLHKSKSLSSSQGTCCSPRCSNYHHSLGPLRLDRVTSFSHIQHTTPEQSTEWRWEQQGDEKEVVVDRMIIKKITEWDVREDYEPSIAWPAPERVAAKL